MLPALGGVTAGTVYTYPLICSHKRKLNYMRMYIYIYIQQFAVIQISPTQCTQQMLHILMQPINSSMLFGPLLTTRGSKPMHYKWFL